MIVTLVARDAAPSGAFERLSKALAGDQNEVHLFVGGGKPLEVSVDTITDHVRNSDCVILGMSSSPELSVEELAAGKAAVESGVLIFLYADRFGTHTRPWFEELRGHTHTVFVINDDQATKAVGFFPPTTNIVVSGNPLWEDFGFPEKDRDRVRNELGIPSDRTMILCPGGKIVTINAIYLSGVLDAVAAIPIHKFTIIFCPHPGDRNDLDNYREMIMWGTDGDRVIGRVLTRDEMPSGVAVAGADLVVDPASTIGAQAAHLRIPVINHLFEVVRGRLREIEGTDDWALAEQGASLAIRNGSVEQLRLAISQFGCQPENRVTIAMIATQKKHYPLPDKQGAAAGIMADTILKIK